MTVSWQICHAAPVCSRYVLRHCPLCLSSLLSLIPRRNVCCAGASGNFEQTSTP